MQTRSMKYISDKAHVETRQAIESPRKNRVAHGRASAKLTGDVSQFSEEFPKTAVFAASNTSIDNHSAREFMQALDGHAFHVIYFNGLNHLIVELESAADAVKRCRDAPFVEVDNMKLKFDRRPELAKRLVAALKSRDFQEAEACLMNLNGASSVEPIPWTVHREKYASVRNIGVLYLNESGLDDLLAHEATADYAGDIVDARREAPFVTWADVIDRVPSFTEETAVAMRKAKMALTSPTAFQHIRRALKIIIWGSRDGTVTLEKPKELWDPRLLDVNRPAMIEQGVVVGPGRVWIRSNPRWH